MNKVYKTMSFQILILYQFIDSIWSGSELLQPTTKIGIDK